MSAHTGSFPFTIKALDIVVHCVTAYQGGLKFTRTILLTGHSIKKLTMSTFMYEHEYVAV